MAHRHLLNLASALSLVLRAAALTLWSGLTHHNFVGVLNVRGRLVHVMAYQHFLRVDRIDGTVMTDPAGWWSPVAGQPDPLPLFVWPGRLRITKGWLYGV